MSFEARVIADSISTLSDVRITTVSATYPRIVHSEMMTHRVFGRNSASTRAIPLKNQIVNLLDNPFIPEKFGVNQPGMQAFRHLDGLKHDEAKAIWLQGRDRALTTAIELLLGIEVAGEILEYESTAHREFVAGDIIREKLPEILKRIPDSKSGIDLADTSLLNVHKQLAGRGLEAYMWHTAIITSTEWNNFFALRDHPDAQGEIAMIARHMRRAIDGSTPRELGEGQWHTPFVEPGEFERIEDAIIASAVRCAATSYNRQDTKRAHSDEVDRYNGLVKGGHMSPLEHQATPFTRLEIVLCGNAANVLRSEGYRLGLPEHQIEQHVEGLQFISNLRGWTPHRKQILGESNFGSFAA